MVFVRGVGAQADRCCVGSPRAPPFPHVFPSTSLPRYPFRQYSGVIADLEFVHVSPNGSRSVESAAPRAR